MADVACMIKGDCMQYLSHGQYLAGCGAAAMAAAVFLAAVCLIVFSFTGRRLKKKLEKEYGPPFDSKKAKGAAAKKAGKTL